MKLNFWRLETTVIIDQLGALQTLLVGQAGLRALDVNPSSGLVIADFGEPDRVLVIHAGSWGYAPRESVEESLPSEPAAVKSTKQPTLADALGVKGKR
jgi:hypothetical protein